MDKDDFKSYPLKSPPDNAARLRAMFGIWLHPMLDTEFDPEFKHEIAVHLGGTPDLASIRVRRGVKGMSYIDTDFHRDMLRWETEASEPQGETGRAYENFGAKVPDGMVYVQTFVFATPISSPASSPAYPPSENHADRKSGSISSGLTSLEKRYGSPGERAYSYLSACHECCGTYLGLLIRGHRYYLVYAISSSLFAIKGSASTTKDQGVGEVMTVQEYLEEFRSLPDVLGTRCEPNLEGFKEIRNFSSGAIDLLVEFPLGKPIPPIHCPNGPIIEALRHLTFGDENLYTTRRLIVPLIESRIIPSGKDVEHNSEPSGPTSLGNSSSLPSPMPVDDDDEEMLLPSGFLVSDFPSELGQEYPDDPEDEWIDEEEREKQDEEDMLYLAQKAVLRERNVKIVPLSSALFNALMEEVKANH
ncbi:hypothetical protein V866_005760 [Kwoniella sp. B9012]|uniref:Cytoplasmic protein n=1 Tax=Kwoniella europaea PYCC6329 TaxID=1423913 RepID=A0AAX4KQ13_9TREE